MSFRDSLDEYARTHFVKDIEKIYYMEWLYNAVQVGKHDDSLWKDVVVHLNIQDQHLPLTDIQKLDVRIAMHCTKCGVDWSPTNFEDAFWVCPDCYGREDATIFP